MIIWTETALLSYQVLMNFVIENWGTKIAIRFEKQVNDLLAKMKIHKKMCPASNIDKNLRKCLVNKHVSLVYELKSNDITVIALYDNRSDSIYSDFF